MATSKKKVAAKRSVPIALLTEEQKRARKLRRIALKAVQTRRIRYGQ